MQPLQVLINLLTQNSNVHICIHDVSGIMKNPLLHLDFKYMIHSCDFCNCAKNTEKGLKLCMTCKMLANTSMSVKEISTEVGFKNPQHFDVVFKKVMGISPTDFRTNKNTEKSPMKQGGIDK